jgi:WD40 repeat protein/serine/threonine protein kinase
VADRGDTGGERRELLARVLGVPVTEEQADTWAERTQAEEPTGPSAEGPDPAAAGHVGEFELLGELGRGGMGVVYRAWQPSLGRQVALKCLLRAGDPKAEARFAREIRALGRVEHPNLVRIFTSGADGDRWFYAMELVEGATLAAVCDRLQATTATGAVDLHTWHEALSTVCAAAREAERAQSATNSSDPPPRPGAPQPGRRPYVRHVAGLVRQAAEAAHALHEAGVVHRDIKPGNIVVDAGGSQAVLMDLGLAQLADDVEGRLTRTRQFVGTLRYASPEQVLSAGALDRRSDVYSLGATLHELLTLRPLYGATEQTPTPELMRRIQVNEPERPRQHNPAVPADLEAVVLKCLEKDPARRYATAGDLAADLGRFLAGEPVRARPVSGWERGVKWVRRRPAAAAMLALGAVALLASVALGVGALHQAGLQGALDEAQRQRDLAKLAQQAADAALASEAEQRRQAEDARREEEAARKKAEQLQQEAEKARQGEKTQRERAETALKEEAAARQAAVEARRNEEQARKQAEAAKERQEGLLYSLGIYRAHVAWEQGDLARARKLLGDLPAPRHNWEWGYLQRLTHFERLNLEGFAFPVNAVAFSPDGKRLASGGDHGELKVWDAETGRQVLPLAGHSGEVRDVAFSPDGLRLVSGGTDKAVKVWNLETGKEVLSLKGVSFRVLAVALSPDGRRVAVGGETDKVRVWDAGSGEEEKDLALGAGRVFGLAFSPDGKRLATATEDRENRTVRVWDLQTRAPTHTFAAAPAAFASVAFSPDGKTLAGAGGDGRVRVWDLQTRAEVFSAGPAARCRLTFSPDGTRLAGGDADGVVRVWDAKTGKEVRTFKKHAGPVEAVAFNPDGTRLASGSDDKTVKVWDADRFQEVFSFDAGGTGVAAFTRDGTRLVAMPLGKPVVTVWDPGAGRQLPSLDTGDLIPYRVALGPDGNLLATLSVRGEVKVWDLPTGKVLFRQLTGKEERWEDVAFSPDGRHLVISGGTWRGNGYNKSLRVYDARTGKEIHKFLEGQDIIGDLAFSPDGRLIAGIVHVTGLGLWDAETGKAVGPIRPHGVYIGALAFSPDGKRLATATPNKVRVWDPKTGQEVLTIPGHMDPRGLAFSPDGTRLAGACGDGTLRFWDAATGEEVLVLKSAWPGALAFSADGKRLLATGNTFRVWEAVPWDQGK